MNDDLKKTLTTIVYTTTSNAVSLLKGIPTFTLLAFFISLVLVNLSNIENPNLPNRDEFLNYYSNAHWSQKKWKMVHFGKNLKS